MSNNSSNPWVVKEPNKSGVPVGNYLARFVGVSDFSHQKIDGPRWRWEWEVTSGPNAGSKADALTPPTISPLALTGKLVAGLLGRAVAPGEDVQTAIQGCVGKSYMVTVSPGDKGGKPMVRFVGQPPAM